MPLRVSAAPPVPPGAKEGGEVLNEFAPFGRNLVQNENGMRRKSSTGSGDSGLRLGGTEPFTL